MPKNHRTRFSLKLVLSLIVISAISLLDTTFFGIMRSNQYPFIVNQMAHVAALMIIGAIGYYNWKDYEEAWLKNLWLLLYGGLLLLLGVLGILYLIKGGNIRYAILIKVPAIKNAFTSPLPFFAFYLLTFANKAMTPTENEKT